MPITFQQVINSPFAVRFVAAAAGALPPAIGYPACDLIGKWIASRRASTLTRAVRLNQWMARGTDLGKEALDKAVRETLQNNARDLYDLYHFLDRPDVIRRRVCPNPLVEELVKRPEFAGRGLVIVGPHLGSFDSILLSMVRRGGRCLVLTIPNPQGGRRVEYEMRRRTGMNILPASLSTIRQAVHHLEQGGLVLTGLDRPVTQARLQPRFYGHPAPLPTHYIHLALKARVPVVVLAPIRQEDGNYKLLNSELFEIEQRVDHKTTILRNAEKVLEQVESFIRLVPQQWNVPLPIWPELLDSVPN